MPQPCCPSPINPCIDPASPITNYSSEAADVFHFFGRDYPGVPPIDGGGHNPGPPTQVPNQPDPPESPCAISPNAGTVFAVSVESDSSARLAANNLMVECVDTTPPDEPPPQSPKIDQPPIPNPPTLEDGSGGGGSPPRQRQKRCNDQIAICEVPCTPYGKFKYQINKNEVCAFTVEEANAMAMSLACQYALQRRICLPPLSPIAWCVDNPYSAFIDSGIEGATLGIGVPPSASGVPVPGLEFNNASPPGNKRAGLITGTPTTAGEFCFVLAAVIDALLQSERTYCILIFDIDCSLFPAVAGQDYADLLELLGPLNRVTNLEWDILEGSLPPGLSLDGPSGVISGHVPLSATPGIYEFTVQACFKATIQGQSENTCCTKVCSITLAPANCPDWTDPASFTWGAFTKVLGPGATGTDASGVTNANEATITAFTGGGSPPDEFWVTADFQNDFIYNGPGCGGRLRLNLTAAAPPAGGYAQVTIVRVSDSMVALDTGQIPVTGNYTFNFDLPDTLGMPETYHLFFGILCGNLGSAPPWNPGSISAVAKLEWQ